MIGLVPAEELKPSDLIGVNKDSFLVLDTLPAGTSVPLPPFSSAPDFLTGRVRLEGEGHGSGRKTNRHIRGYRRT